MGGWGASIALAVAILASSDPGLAQQTEITISMDPPPATPRINGPRIIGWRPGTPLLYSIAATGESPLTFAATLPDGLSIDASSGTISGTTPTAGTYPIDVTVTNGQGSAAATLTLVAGDTLALTPPMGWNSYDSFYGDVRESQVLDAAEAMRSILQPFGWNTIVIDYLWYESAGDPSPDYEFDEYGRLLPDTGKYPNANGPNGFTPIAEQIHAMGMSFGIHLMRGIPRNAFSADTPILDSSFSAQDAGNSSDACPWDDHMWGVRGDTEAGQAWYDSIYSQYAEWGVDFVKVDDMMNPYGGNVVHDAEVAAVHNALYSTNRSIVYSLSPGPHPTSAVQVLNANANMWRTVNDFWDTNGLSTMDNEFDAAHAWAETDGITQGHWPDADMLPLGIIGNRECAFTHNQQVTVMTLWSIMPSPLMFGGQPTRLEGDDWTVALLTNEEVLAVNQDALGSRGRRISQQGSSEVWARDISGGRKAVALFNRGANDATIAVTFSELGVSGTPTVRDLWRKQDVADATSGLSVNVPNEAALMYMVTPPGAGVGGAGGSAGAGDAGGTSESGGMVDTGGTSGTGGTGDAGAPLALGGMNDTGGASNTGGWSNGGTTGEPGGSTADGGVVSMGGASAGGNPSGGLGGTQGGSSGTPGLGGTPGAGGRLVTGGTANGGAGVGGSSSGGVGIGGRPNDGAVGGKVVAGTGGDATSAGAEPQGVDESSAGDDGGCSCRLPSSRTPANPWLLACAALLLARRSRRSRSR